MPSHVQNFMQSAAPGKSSVAKQQANRAFDLGTSESRFADSLKRARTDGKSKPARTETDKATATQKPLAAKSKKSDRANERADEREPLDSTVAAERSHKGEAKPNDEATDVIEGKASNAETDAAPSAEKENGDGDSSLTPAEVSLAVQMTAEPSPVDGVADVFADDVTTDETTPTLATTAVKRPVVAAVEALPRDVTEADAVEKGATKDAGGDIDILATLGLDESTDTEDTTAAPRTNAAISTPIAEKTTNPKLQTSAVDEAPAADAPTDTETENAVKPVQGNLASQSGDADAQLDLAQQSANPLDAKTTSVATTAIPTAEVNVAPAPVAAASNHTAPLPATPQTPQVTVPDFAETNHDKIVTSLRSTAFDKGGTMEIRLDPPELGALQVSVRMQDGVMTASFLTSNDEATRLLSHSLGQLKHVLESAGVTVDKLQVQQSSKNDNDTTGEGRHHSERDDSSARQEQQRKEMIKRMWQKLSGVPDPLDMVA